MGAIHGRQPSACCRWFRATRHAAIARRRQPSPFWRSLLALGGAAPAAHDIPNDVTVQTFLKPEGQRLRLLVRVPLGAMRDMDYPKPRRHDERRSARPGRADTSAARRGDALAERLSSTCTRRPAARRAAGRLGARLAASRTGRSPPTTRRSRTSPARGCPTRHGVLLEPGAARRPVRVPDPVGPVAVLDSSAARAPRHPHADRPALPAARRRRARRSSSTAIPGWCGSIRAGTRRRSSS